MTKNDFLGFLHAGDFRQLFLECFWNNPTSTTPYPIAVGENTYSVEEVAQKNGFCIFKCKVAKIPDATERRLIDSKLRKYKNYYFLVFEEPTFHHLWSVPVKSVDKRQLVTVEYVQDDQAAFLLEKVNAISFSFNEEPTIVDVVDRVNAAFLVNTTEVTKKFYQGFKKQHDQFVKGIVGLGDDKDREWYASVMLNRLMFCYFVQKKGFLDFNENYLSDKLAWVQKTRGENKFDSFYRSFLKNLFSDGLNKPAKGRTKYFIKTYGRIPYLNGGMFAEHEIESRNRDIDIPDQVFETLFAFFDQWHWHLDNRLTASGRDINPDVLGYIFEQYINDRAQMGAYYTKEDITEYIGRNCILPFLFQKVKIGEWAWNYLRKSGDRYIFAAVKKGVELPLPDYIERGVSTKGSDLRARRSRWNEKADEAYALPTEIWRETVARRQRYAEVRGKIEKGEITDIHDFITYNLDIRSFAEDILRETDDHHLVGRFYKAVREVTVLDPTCGSGAFLFAALNILEPLYEICLDRMEEFHGRNPKLFKDELAEIKDKFRSNQKYFIYKNIILRNLYGVDIMHEATEIARLRLFLKMMAVVDVDPYDENLGLDPLPDIDFNVKCGNTLVGYASEQEIQDGLVNGDMFAWAELKGKIDDELKKVSMAFKYFRDQQLDLNPDNQSLAETKAEVKKRLAAIRTLLDDQLYDRHSGKKKAQWLTDTQPFHWYTEFYPIMAERGGFDVIIGNPPYLEKKQIGYDVMGYASYDSNAVHAWCIERSTKLLNTESSFGMIVPLSLPSTQRMKVVQEMLEHDRNAWYANYSWRPAKLFDTVNRALTIFITDKGDEPRTYSTNYQKWTSDNRDGLFDRVPYVEVPRERPSCWVPKCSDRIETSILGKLLSGGNKQLGLFLSDSGERIYYRTDGGLYWKVFTDFAPRFVLNGIEGHSSRETWETFQEKKHIKPIIAILSSDVFWWWYTVTSNVRHLNPFDLHNFYLSETALSDKCLAELAKKYLADIAKNSTMLVRQQKKTGRTETQSFEIKLSKPIIDEIDELLAKHYGFTEEELDFIINYDIKYRMGDELNAEE